ncbi:p-loop containing nucleoside triphosphate hydrolase protein [Rutstroemia sp. NJR-2017a WRK4]|nr:p-loop containing nucleoside triphosphate hydrolase protein [Rutstroemia sp. NJR-2017a WRK4]
MADLALLEAVFNHLVLPPRLPERQDTDIESIQQSILSRLIQACDTLEQSTGDAFKDTWASVRQSLRVCRDTNPGHLEKVSMLSAFADLEENDILILHVVEQNAALLVRRNIEDTVIFESFETSPSSEIVLASENALHWDFPGRSAEISVEEFNKKSFQESLAVFLEQASMESLNQFRAHIFKAKVSVIESRDTTDPALITQMLLTLLEAVGSPADVPRFTKRVRDDVNIRDAELPWRRLPFWLVLRVSIQRQLCLALGNDSGRAHYKFFMCTILAELLEDCAGQLPPELTMTLKAKLCRRLAKLELDKRQTDSAEAIYEQLFSLMGPRFTKTVQIATDQIESAWAKFKRAVTRKITPLPLHADNQDLRVSLPNSKPYIHKILNLPWTQRRHPASADVLPAYDGAMKQVEEFANRCFNQAELEARIEEDPSLTPKSATDCQNRCIDLAKSIDNLFNTTGNFYDAIPEQTSIFILNLFELWVRMDECAVKACPLLLDYAPAFASKLLDVLQLPTLSYMQRLQRIQLHLSKRYEEAQYPYTTFFCKLDEDCFATNFVEQSPKLCKLRKEIENASKVSRERKKTEWTKACEQYDKLTQKIADGTCTCSIGDDGNRNVKGCTKCWQKRTRKRMKISTHEDFLPEDMVQKAAVVFELGIPSFLAAYRDATFRIFSDLGHPHKPDTSSSPAMLLKDYSQLQRYIASVPNGISLASTKKSFLQTHYKELKMKVKESDVLRPLALDFAYYDMKSGLWLEDLDRQLTLQHLCGVYVPRSLQVSVVPPPPHPLPNVDGPSSYETIASQTKCPPELSIQEFMSYQGLLAGKNRRWPNMLVELGATNLNFSVEDTMHIFNQLAIQAGPSRNMTEVLRDVHLVFRDDSFCQHLVKQIDDRLRNICTNWRETHCMDMLITLSLRLYSLTSGTHRQSAERLIKIARQSTMQWISRLRDEVQNSTQADAAETAAGYAFWAAMLCRRTFAVFLESANASYIMKPEDLCCFIQASVALQENIVIDLEKLNLGLKAMLIRDMKMAYQLKAILKHSIQSSPDSLGTAIDATWSKSGDCNGRNYSPWKFLSSPNQKWLVSTTTTLVDKHQVHQLVHYNFVEGHLLVDHKPLGRLPLEIRESEDVKELFGDKHLLTFPSQLSGMSHFAPNPVDGNEVHFGLRGGSVVIRALNKNRLLEYVPRRVFTRNDAYDLPLALVENCVHWLNIRTKRVEIRRKENKWKPKLSNWSIDFMTHRVQRKKLSLVDPHSDLCKRVTRIFQHFEDPQRLTVYQPETGTLCLEMRHLELSFFVNEKQLLECRELHAEIDPDQDAGTLYGLQSKIVLRDVVDNDRRSVITALGNVIYNRQGMHVAVRVIGNMGYGKFGIDEVLGRLSCPPEPRLLYSKAQFHAFTSFILPDPLTGRTGAEEALHTLRSGYCQPWNPLVEAPASILRAIKSLTPVREYYPRDKRSLQTVIWDNHLTTNIQHDSYAPLVNEILAKSHRLQAFHVYNLQATSFDVEAPPHLQKRSEGRRCLYERSTTQKDGQKRLQDMVYDSRDRQATLPQATNVFQIVKLFSSPRFRIKSKNPLPNILEGWNFIGGFQEEHKSGRHMMCISDLIENNVGEQWGNLVNIGRHTDVNDAYEFIFRLALLSFDAKSDMDAIRVLAAFGRLEELKALEPPPIHSFPGFKYRESPTHEWLLGCIAADYPAFKPTRRGIAFQQEAEKQKHLVLCETEGKRLAEFLLDQWPSPALAVESFKPRLIDVKLALKRILPEWQRLYHNWELSEYATEAQKILDRFQGPIPTKAPLGWNSECTPYCAPERGEIIPTLSADLLAKSGPPPWNPSFSSDEKLAVNGISRGTDSTRERNGRSDKINHPIEIADLGKILDSFITSSDLLRQQYGTDLKKSLTALENIRKQPESGEIVPTPLAINESIDKTRKALDCQFEGIRAALSAGNNRFQWLQQGSLWPCITPITILEQLRSSYNHEFGSDMKESLISYGVLTTKLQKLLRMKHSQLKKNHSKVLEELRNVGHENWNPLDFPDWLLIEIEGDILIRPEQIDVAHAIISPASGSNSVMQMNMGKGKSSCIVPMAMAVLADKKQLCRLIVPKALLLQTAQTIQSKLGGLVGREIRHIPFSRRTLTSQSMLRLYSQHHHETFGCSGIILATPEHILSYKLCGLQRLADSKLEEAKEMIKFQSWLTNTCRDVLDESDFTLAVKTQMIYPSGPQVSVDGHPHRWEIPQVLLSIVEDHLPSLQRDFPRSIEVISRPGGFPMIHFLQTDVEDALQSRLINDICDGRVSFLRLTESQLPANRLEIKRVLLEKNLDHGSIERVSQYFVDKYSAGNNILLVRGLILHRVLLLCLKKRWNVQYGLHPNRDPIAVPFEAKGTPSEQAEFGHPDVSILFTCLAFYYSGLNQSQFQEGLQHVLKSDNPAAEYDRWTLGCVTLPEALQNWNVINADDQGQFEQLWQNLRLNRNVLDHYMNTFVFPVHAKQFGIKLQASGWDLPLFTRSQAGNGISCVRTTGFSGTNDNKMMLPLTIKQDDLESLRQTSAEVLTYILQSRNRRGYDVTSHQGKRLTEVELLNRVFHQKIRILIDAGAYILEMDNRALVKEWLTIDTRAKGAVFFGIDNRAWVMYRDDKEVPLMATPFAENLDEVLVYIDEAHTRGVDLKLPQGACGALTLALGQTKDHTLQAAMRLRQLGTTQSIYFFAPPEVHQSILDVCEKKSGDALDSSHIVRWLLEQTCQANEHLQNLYIAQGTDFCRRTNAEWENLRLLTAKIQREAYLDIIQQPERQTLEHLYGAVVETQPLSSADMSYAALKDFVEKLSKQRRAVRGDENGTHSSVLEEVEQEREVEHQVEEVREVQKPVHYKALAFPGLSKVIYECALSGRLRDANFEHVFKALARTSVGHKYNVSSTRSRLFVCREFMHTINLKGRTINDNFVRPVEWILWSPSDDSALIIIPEEAELLIPILRAMSEPRAYLIAYTTPVTKSMLRFDGLSYYTIPTVPARYKVPDWLSIELGIVAGRLYFPFAEYAPLMEYLQLSDPSNGEGVTQGTNMGRRVPVFTNTPTNFLHDWLTLRRKGQNIMHTPMGYVCQRRPLRSDHPFFIKRNVDSEVESKANVGTVEEADDENGGADLADEWDSADDLE